MSFTNDDFLTVAYLVSNCVGILLLLVALKWPKVARLLLVCLFGWASWLNYTTCHQHPEMYQGYAQFAVVFYKDFINGWFASNTALVVGSIAFGQALIALGLLLYGNWVKWACIGAIIFLAAIAPLGLGSAFPFSITVSLAAYFILRKDDMQFLLNFSDSKPMKLMAKNQ